jgi:hypothetical protein
VVLYCSSGQRGTKCEGDGGSEQNKETTQTQLYQYILPWESDFRYSKDQLIRMRQRNTIVMTERVPKATKTMENAYVVINC